MPMKITIEFENVADLADLIALVRGEDVTGQALTEITRRLEESSDALKVAVQTASSTP